jgi:hypothetical protein
MRYRPYKTAFGVDYKGFLLKYSHDSETKQDELHHGRAIIKKWSLKYQGRYGRMAFLITKWC